MKAMTNSQIAAASTKELVAYYNHFTGKSITKFSSRAAAERQCAAYAADETQIAWAGLPFEQRLALWHKEGRCPHCGDVDNGVTAAGLDGTVAGDHRSFCHICGTEFWNETGKKYNAPANSESRSKSIASSWADPEIRADRIARCHVEVDGVVYASVAKAFKALKLDMGPHIRVRMEVKVAGKCLHAGYVFIATTK